MRSLLEHIKHADWVEFNFADSAGLHYTLFCATSDQDQWDLDFTIPLADIPGGTFPKVDNQPKHYQRWIRQALEVKAEEEKMIARAKEEWSNDQRRD